ncbi:3-hydroxyacyl-CoA dehydrogenase NAD-binding domain-containing protein [Pseudomonas poae]
MKEIKVAVIGSGTMGKGIVQLLAQSEVTSSIVWIGRSETGCKAAYESLKFSWERMVNKKDCLLKMQYLFQKK